MYRRNWLEEMDQIGGGGGCGSGCCSANNENGVEEEKNENTRIIMITRRRERLWIRKDSERSWRRRTPYYKDLSRILAIFLVILSVGSSMAVMAYHNDLSSIASSSSSSSRESDRVSAHIGSATTTTSSSNRLGCAWSRTGSGGGSTNINSNSASASLNNGKNNNGQQSSGGGMFASGNNPFQQRQQHQTFPSSGVLSPSASSSASYFSSVSSSSAPLAEGGAGGMLSLSCNVRTLNADFSNYTSASSFTREQVEQARVAKVRCSDKLFFQSFLFPNQSMFQLRNLREVEIDSCKIRKIPKSVFASWRFLKKLEIHTHNFQWGPSVGLELEAGAFQGLESVEVLDLSQSNIWTLFPEPNVLCPMRNLRKFNGSWNRLTDVDEFGLDKAAGSGSKEEGGGGGLDGNYFCALNIQSMDLSYNFLRRIGKSGFSRLSRLVELKLHHNLLEELEDTSLSGLNQLKHLDLSSNRLVALPPSIFSKGTGGPGNLQEIIISNNSISALSPKVFDGLDQLLLLDLSNNFLQNLSSEKVFSGLIRLVVLKLSFNQLSSIPSILFSDLTSLQALYLDNNNIEVIQPESFTNLRNLNTIDLKHNKLSTIDSRLFSNNFVLKQLFLDHNDLRHIDDEALKNCTSLEDLGISQNKLTSVPVAIRAGLGQLKTLDLGENRITTLSNESFRGLSQIYGLRLVENRISELPAGFCESLKNLRVLNCAQNKISRVSSTAFHSCPHVRALRLDSNLLEEIPLTLTDQLPSLLWLNVSDNHRLKWVDYRLLPPSLEWLDVSHNQLTSLSKPLQIPLPQVRPGSRRSKASVPPPTFNLRVLDASFNQLSSLDHTHIPPLLDTLRLNHNEIKSIAPDTFTAASQLRRVELIGNQIESLPLASIRFQQIAKERRLPEIYLGDNPFLCECSMEWLTRVNQLEVLRQYPRIVDLNSIVCRPTFPTNSNAITATTTTTTAIQSRNNSSSSSSLSSNQFVIPLLEARPKDFLCPYTSHCFALCSCCDFEFCDCSMQCPGNCTCYHDSSWSVNIVQCSNLEYVQVPPRMPMDATEIYLDGNNFGNELNSHIFIGKKNLRGLFLNNSQIESIRNKTFNGLKSLEILHLQNNFLQQVQGYEFADVSGLKELYLQNNQIRYVSPNSFEKMTFLQVLRLDGNLLVNYNVWELSKTNGYLHSVMLSGNPWTCNCDFVIPLRRWVSSLKNTVVVDYTIAKCEAEGEQQQQQLEDNNNSNSSAAIVRSPTGSTSIPSSRPALISSLLCSGTNDNLNNHISSVGGASAPTMNNNFGPYHHAHLENGAGNYYAKEFPQNENIIATTSAAAASAAGGERGGRRSSQSSVTHHESNLSENSTVLICIATIVALLLVASFVLILGLVRRKRGGGLASHSSWWLCCFSKCGINGGSALALANKFLSAQTTSSSPNEGESNDGSGSYYYSESGKLFDAYFIYSQQDEEFVEKLTGELEQGGGGGQQHHQHYYPPTNSNNKLKLLFQRDLCLAPPWNSEMIKSACDASKRIVLVISNNFLNFEWTNTHFRGSLLAAIQQNWGKLIVIKMHDSNITNDNYWRSILSVCERNGNNNMQGSNNSTTTTTFPFPANLDWSDSNFWPKFRLLLPQSPMMGRGGGIGSSNNRNDLIPITNSTNFSTISSTTLQQLPYNTHLNMNGMSILNPATAPFIPYQVSQQNQQPQNFITLMNFNGQQGYPLSHLSNPQQFAYSNIDSFQNIQQSNVRTSLRHNGHPLQPQPPPPPHHRHQMPMSRDAPQHIHSLSQLSSNIDANYSSSAVSSGNDEFDHDHVYSTLDSPMSDLAPQFEGGQLNRHQIQHSHSNSSGISSGSDVDATSGSGGGCHPVPPMYFV